MNLPFRGFTDIVRDMSAAITASGGRLIDMSVGSVLRAIIEANAAIALWVQWLVLLTLQSTRAATSVGQDLDSWMADFSLARLPSRPASGVATFSRYSGGTVTYVPAGTMVKTQDGSVGFAVTPDSSNPAWEVSLNSFSLGVGVTSIDLPVVASTAGLSGNVLPNTITILASSIPGIVLVCYNYSKTGGGDAEGDSAFRSRFANFFAARSRATLDALGYAISLVSPTLKYIIQENVDATGGAKPGNILIIIDDGSGLIEEPLLNSLSIVTEVVRPIGTSISFQPPQIVQVQVSLSVKCPDEIPTATVWNQLMLAIEEYISKRPIGSTLSITRISQLAYRTEPQIINVSDVMVNGQTVDLLASPTAAFRFQSVTFT